MGEKNIWERIKDSSNCRVLILNLILTLCLNLLLEFTESAILQRKEIRLADSRHRLCRDRCLLLIRWKYRDRKFIIFRPFHRSFISIGICTVPCHNEPVKDRPDERITAHFLCLSFRRNLSLYRNQQYQPSSAYQRMAYCRKSNLAGIDPDRRF